MPTDATPTPAADSPVNRSALPTAVHTDTSAAMLAAAHPAAHQATHPAAQPAPHPVANPAAHPGEEPPSARRRTVWWAAWLAAYWLALLAATHVPWRAARRIEHADKVGHFIAYAILAALLYATGRLVFRRSAWLLVGIYLLCAVYATIDEWLQTFVPRRTADVYDWCADLAGAACALGICVLIRRRDR